MAIANAVLLSLVAGLATGLGGLLVAAFREMSMRTYDGIIGFAAGVMTAVATLGLIHESASNGNALVAVLGVPVGAGMLLAFDRFLPHQHVPFDCPNPALYRRGLLLLAAMTLHNLPEGLAIGTSYTAQPRLGMLLTLAITLHNIPEGIAVAGPLRACGMPRWKYVGWAVISGMAEPLAALLGATFVTLFRTLLPFSLAFAGGAMLYVVSDELVPESHSHGFEHEATVGFVLGFVLLLALLRM